MSALIRFVKIIIFFESVLIAITGQEGEMSMTSNKSLFAQYTGYSLLESSFENCLSPGGVSTDSKGDPKGSGGKQKEIGRSHFSRTPNRSSTAYDYVETSSHDDQTDQSEGPKTEKHLKTATDNTRALLFSFQNASDKEGLRVDRNHSNTDDNVQYSTQSMEGPKNKFSQQEIESSKEPLVGQHSTNSEIRTNEIKEGDSTATSMNKSEMSEAENKAAAENVKPKLGNTRKGKFLQRASTVMLGIGKESTASKKISEEYEKKMREELETSNQHIEILNVIIAFADKPRDLGGKSPAVSQRI